ncbi:MAG: TolC family protein, partial [Bryobacteraceae bacterium]
ARAYVAALRADADIEATSANVTLAEAVVRQAESLKLAGTGTGIEVTRARVQLAMERQRLLAAENERRRTRLALLRSMDAGLDTAIELTDRLTYEKVDGEALEIARADVDAQERRAEAARLAASAVKLERLPSVTAFGDYGSIGRSWNHSLPTRTIGVSVRFPVFDGGRREARRAESASLWRAEQIRTRDVKKQAAMEKRLALDALRSSDELVKVAAEGLALAQSELEQARRRYEAGVAPGLEVTDAQTRLARARDGQVAALFQHAMARVELQQATGRLRREGVR